MSEVPPQGSYMAKRCPNALQLDVLHPCEPLPTSSFISMLGDEGRDFEADIFELLAKAIPDAVVIDESLPRNVREAATVAAMDDGVPLVIGGRLPVDRMGLRAGEPDLLVRSDAFTPRAAAGGYLPVDVKHHKTSRAQNQGRCGRCYDTSELEALFVRLSEPDAEWVARWRRDDLLQLAHYQRMLEAAGRASQPGRWAGIVGREGRVVWYELDVPLWHPTGVHIEDPPPQELSTMEMYDLEFDYRLTVIDASLAHLSDPTSPLLAEPIAVSDCDTCRWHDWCFQQMESSGDISLLPGMSVEKRFKYLARGVTTLRELASLDTRTARLISAGVDLQHLAELALDADAATPVTVLLAGRPKQAEGLWVEGFATAADVARLDPRTAAFRNAGLGDLPQQIDNAAGPYRPSPGLYRRRGVDRVVVPRADVEVDVDMENVGGGCYLWGTLLNVRDTPGAIASDYLPFYSWNPDTGVGEIESVSRLLAVVLRTSERGGTKRASRSARLLLQPGSRERTAATPR